jgi:hypothetical protein
MPCVWMPKNHPVGPHQCYPDTELSGTRKIRMLPDLAPVKVRRRRVTTHWLCRDLLRETGSRPRRNHYVVRDRSRRGEFDCLYQVAAPLQVLVHNLITVVLALTTIFLPATFGIGR